MKQCRNCATELRHTFADLGHTPLSNSYLTNERLDDPETWYPLHAYVCDNCMMVQLGHNVDPNRIFTKYDYWSSTSPTWVECAKRYAERMIDELKLDSSSLVIEIGSNDGYLLKHFKNHNINVLGIEPAKNIADAAVKNGIPTINKFFGRDVATSLKNHCADLVCGTNVLAHVPDIQDFVGSISMILSQRGTCTMEFPWIKNLIKKCQFDTIYHEHYSYFSLKVVESIFAQHNMVIYHVEHLETHGGSIRVYACHKGYRTPDTSVYDTLRIESESGLLKLECYTRFNQACKDARIELASVIRELYVKGESLAVYGAPAKGNTLLNTCGVTSLDIQYAVDDSPHKQGKYLPGSHIEIVSREHFKQYPCDVTMILAWNLAEPIMAANRDVKTKWLIPIPEPKFVENSI